MADRLVTIATFDTVVQAQMAQGVLKDANIPAVLTDQETVSLFWHLSNAIGGIKVQVREEHAEQAVGVLEESLGPASEVDQENLAVEAEATKPDPDDEVDHRNHPAPRPPVGETLTEPPTAGPDSRNEDARRLVFAAWLGMPLPPVSFYALYLFLNAAFGVGKLSGRGRFNLLIGGSITFIEIFSWYVIFLFLFHS